MVLWVFGYGSLIWKAGFNYDDRLVGFIKGYRRVFYQGFSSLLRFFYNPVELMFDFVSMIAGSTDHRGTPEYPGRTVTLEPADGEVCWGAAYKICNEEDIQTAITYLEVREKQYDEKGYLDFYTDSASTTPTVSGVVVYIASPNRKLNPNYLGPASMDEIAKQIVKAEGPSGPNKDYLFNLEKALLQMDCEDAHVMGLADEVRKLLTDEPKNT